MKQFDVVIMKFELENQEIWEEIQKFQNKKNIIEIKKMRERKKLSVVDAAFKESSVVDVAALYGGYDGSKIKKLDREKAVIEGMIKKLSEEAEVIDEKIKVIREEKKKLEIDKIKQEEKKAEKQLLDIKIINERGN